MKPARIVLGNADGPAERLSAWPELAAQQPARGAAFHGQDSSSLWLLLGGTAVLDIGGAQVVLPRRRLCILRDAAVSVHLEGRVSMLALAFPSLALDERLRGRAGAAAGRRRMLFPEVGIDARALLASLRQRQPQRPGAAEAWLEERLIDLVVAQQRRLAELLARSPGRTHFERCRSLRRLMLARSLLQMEGGERVPVAKLAELACYSPSQFVRTFNSVFQRTPGELRQQLRLCRAKSLLATTRLSVDEVAAEVGYENRSAFARMFRAGTGMSASQYRGLRCTQPGACLG